MKSQNLTVISNVLSVGKKRLLFAPHKKMQREKNKNDETERCFVSFSSSEKKREKKRFEEREEYEYER